MKFKQFLANLTSVLAGAKVLIDIVISIIAIINR